MSEEPGSGWSVGAGWGWLGLQVADILNVSNLTDGIGVKVLELG